MADTTLNVYCDAYPAYIEFLRKRGCHFMALEVGIKNKEELLRQPDPLDPIPNSFHWYVYSPHFTLKEHEIKLINNIHVGPMYCPDEGTGGPHFVCHGWKKQQKNIEYICILILYNKAFLVNGLYLAPPKELKALYQDSKKFLKKYVIKELGG